MTSKWSHMRPEASNQNFILRRDQQKKISYEHRDYEAVFGLQQFTASRNSGGNGLRPHILMKYYIGTHAQYIKS